MPLSELTERLYNLRRDRSSGYEKPYKPALLLTLIDLIEQGRYADNRIDLSDELIEHYKEFIRIVGRPGDHARIQYPFWYLSSDGLWQILDRKRQPMLRPGHPVGTAPSVAELRRRMSYASFDEELFAHLMQPADREVLRSALISRYFPAHRALLDALRRERPHPEPNQRETPAQYDKNPARSQAFAKTVKAVYDYRCAACGIRVRIGDDVLVEACHLIPFAESYNDHPTNGMALCKNHHWALDRRLIAPTRASDRLVWKPSPLLDERLEGQDALISLKDKDVLLPRERKFHPAAESVEWRSQRLLSA